MVVEKWAWTTAVSTFVPAMIVVNIAKKQLTPYIAMSQEILVLYFAVDTRGALIGKLWVL